MRRSAKWDVSVPRVQYSFRVGVTYPYIRTAGPPSERAAWAGQGRSPLLIPTALFLNDFLGSLSYQIAVPGSPRALTIL